MSETREHFRIDFLESDRPKLIIKGVTYTVVDLSEGGCKFTGSPILPDDALLNGTIKFGDDSLHEVSGRVIRSDLVKREAIAEFDKGVPFPTMMKEHRRLIKKYKS